MTIANKTSNNKKLGKRLAAYSLGVAGVAALVPQADAAVVPVTFGFGPSWDSSDQTSGNRTSFTVGPGYGTIGFYTSSYFGAMGGGGYWSGGASNTPNAFVYGDGVHNNGNPGSKVSFLSNGTVVGTGLNGTSGTPTASMATLHWRDHNGDTAYELGTNVSGFNFGFKTETGHFGWANADWLEGFNGYGLLTINAAYVESVAGDPITVGDTGASAVPEPSSLALLSLGAAGLLALRQLRRRSKQTVGEAA